MFLSGFINLVVRKTAQIAQRLTRQYQAGRSYQVGPKVGASGIRFLVHTNVAQVRGNAEAQIMVYLDRDVQATFKREIGKHGRDVVRKTLDPIKRTGKVAKSFKYKIDSSNNSVIIYSDSPAAAGIQSGIRHTGHTDSLISWLRTKKEHRKKSDKELKKLAFFIRRKINRGDAPGPGSDLRRLEPQGERKFDYITIAAKQIEKDLTDALTYLTTI